MQTRYWFKTRVIKINTGTANSFINASGRLYRLYKTGDLRRDNAIAPFVFTGNPAMKRPWTAVQIHDHICG